MKGNKTNLKSNMDRFIASVIQKLRYIQIYLKSNMDRFIANHSD